MKVTLLFITLLSLLTLADWAAGEENLPSRQHKCPVCGMFVHKYPEWIGRIAFKDGSVVFFDGAKDLFQYYFNLKKYSPGKDVGDIEEIHVTEYYGVRPLPAQEAFFVFGSSVYGPMGRELIPLQSKGDAEEFMRDHQGKRVLLFHEVTREVMHGLE